MADERVSVEEALTVIETAIWAVMPGQRNEWRTACKDLRAAIEREKREAMDCDCHPCELPSCACCYAARKEAGNE